MINFGMYAADQALQSAVLALIAWTLARHRLLLFAVVSSWAFACWPALPLLGG